MPSYNYSDFDINFNRNEFIGDVSVMKDRFAIRQSIVNIVMTRPGEKPFKRAFGVGLHDYLFENWTPRQRAFLERDIVWAVRAFEPRAEVESVIINTDNIDSNQVDVEIRFYVLGGRQTNPIIDSIKLAVTKVR